MTNGTTNHISLVRLYGAGGHSQVIKETLELNKINVESYFDDYPTRKHFKVNKLNKGIRVEKNKFSHKGSPFIICIGNNNERAEIASLIDNKFSRAIHPTAIISNNSIIGDGTVVFAGAIIQPNTKIGRHVIVNTGASIDHDNIIGDYAHISPKATLCGHVEIGEGTHIGVSACVIPKVKIGKWCTIGAGAVIIKDIPDYSTVVGSPGRIIKRNFPKRLNKNNDLTFIGSGISSSYTLLKLLEKISIKNTLEPLKISIIEKSKEFHTGIPYGYRSSKSTLLIKPLNQFLPIKELKKFTDWLSINKSWLISETLFDGGKQTQKWFDENESSIICNSWDDLYIPRCFFGKYITSAINKKINYLKNKKHISLDLIFGKANIIDREMENGNYIISLKNDSNKIKTKRIVLGVGSVSNKNLFSIPETSKIEEKTLLIEDPYEPSINNALNQIKDFSGNKDVNILIIGTNASGIELAYKLNDHKGLASKINHIFTLSPQKKFPDFNIDYNDSIKFIPIHLLNLTKSNKEITALKISKASKRDLDFAEANNISAIYSIQPICTILPELLSRLNNDEKEKFAVFFGNNIGKRQREAGKHYSNLIKELEESDKITYIEGKFLSINLIDKNITIKYESSKNKEQKILDNTIDIIINCSGGCSIQNSQNTNTLLVNLEKNDICKINKSNKGFYVNNNLEASKSFFINGPLLSGNVIDGNPIWHVEHGKRIVDFSIKLAEILYKDIYKK